jgi:hypothetical protein
MAVQRNQKPKLMLTYKTGTIAGIAVGCGISLILLLGVLYIYWLRARQFQRLHSKKGKRGRKGSSAAGGDGGGG